MKIGKLKFGLWRAVHETRGKTKPYPQIFCTIIALPIYWTGALVACFAILVGEWSIDEAISKWKEMN